MIIAIDGPAASGKSTTARLVAQKLGFTYLDTGAMYRAVTYALLEQKIPFTDVAQVSKAVAELDIALQTKAGQTIVRVNGRDISDAIRSKRVTDRVSACSAIPVVRREMVKLQRRMGREQNCVIEGRDIGTVVFPDAEWKFYIVADVTTRARRRLNDLNQIGESRSLETLIREINERDKKDSSRDHSPLKKAADAIEIDTSSLTIDEQVDFIIQTVTTKGKPKE
ncbi:MAG: (d)CMP kinase [Fidelibacterota bacterium]